MLKWSSSRFEVFRSVSLGSGSFRLLVLFQILVWALHWMPPVPGTVFLTAVPGWGWALGWLAYLWLTTLGYAAERKGRFDFTSMNFFRSYLDFIINEGGRLLLESDGLDFYTKVSDWQRQAVEGIAIGLGPKESEDFFQKTAEKSPLEEAYREAGRAGNNDALCRALLVNIEELKAVRARVAAPEEDEKDLVQAHRPSPSRAQPPEERPLKRIGGSKAGPARQGKSRVRAKR